MSETTSPTPAPAADDLMKADLAKLRSSQGEAILSIEEKPEIEMYWVNVRPRALPGVARLLRDDPALDYKLLTDVTCVDKVTEDRRFNVMYNFYSVTRSRRLFLRVRVDDGEHVPSLAGLYPSANAAEREVYDLFGVIFDGHPDLRRIMMPDEWDGHPLRKDYPTVGKRPVILFNDVKDIL
jgi:NADH-quinone oxidoreductase subunit C